MNPEYDSQSPEFNHMIKLNREHLMKFVGELHDMQMNMIEEALTVSDMQESKDVIKYIMEKN